MNFARACQDHTLAARIQVGIPRNRQTNENGKCLTGKKTYRAFMWILRAPVRITFLPQGSKLEPQGTAKGMKMGNVWWVTKHKRLLCELCVHLSGAHFCRKDPSWTPKGQPKEWKWKMSKGQKNINEFYVNFDRTCQYHTFAARIQVGTPKEQPKEWKWKMSNG